jgi:signal transduction histidine kinase
MEEKLLLQREYEQQLVQSQLEVREATFSELGKELHDNVGQLLNSTKLLIGITQRNIPDAPDTLFTADETLAKAIQELRALSKSLNKEWLQQFNFLENLQTEIERINSSNTIKIHFNHPQKIPFNADEQVILFRIVQESVQNIMKHAEANIINIEIKEDASFLQIIINDNGLGFEKNNIGIHGIGMLNMKHRTELLGGKINWESSMKGTKVTIQLPIKTNEA